MSSPKHVEVRSDGFLVGSKYYFFDRVTSIRFYHSTQRVSINVTVDCGDNHHAELDIWYEAEKDPIKIRAYASFHILTIHRSEARAVALVDIYIAIRERTADTRMKFYRNSITEKGYFSYNNKKFFPDGTITDGEHTINILKVPREKITRGPFYLSVETEKSRMARFMQSVFSSKDFGINTERDSDVFYELLASLYELKWIAVGNGSSRYVLVAEIKNPFLRE